MSGAERRPRARVSRSSEHCGWVRVGVRVRVRVGVRVGVRVSGPRGSPRRRAPQPARRPPPARRNRTWYVVRGTWYVARGTWHVVRGTWWWPPARRRRPRPTWANPNPNPSPSPNPSPNPSPSPSRSRSRSPNPNLPAVEGLEQRSAPGLLQREGPAADQHLRRHRVAASRYHRGAARGCSAGSYEELRRATAGAHAATRWDYPWSTLGAR